MLSSHIFDSQRLVREFAEKHYKAPGVDEEEAKELARSCVSQRDIQVLHISNFVMLLTLQSANDYHFSLLFTEGLHHV